MKAISLWQPWASLIVTGAKKIETRSWPIKYRGPLAIHAAKRRPPKQGEISSYTFRAITDALTKYYGAWRYDWYLGGTRINSDGRDNGFDIPLGAVVAIVNLVDCSKVIEESAYPPGESVLLENGMYVRGNELLFGDYTIGRYAWILEDIQALPEPIPAKGMQGIWEWKEGDALGYNH